MLFPYGFPRISHLLFPSHASVERTLQDEVILKCFLFLFFFFPIKSAYSYYGYFDQGKHACTCSPERSSHIFNTDSLLCRPLTQSEGMTSPPPFLSQTKARQLKMLKHWEIYKPHLCSDPCELCMLMRMRKM